MYPFCWYAFLTHFQCFCLLSCLKCAGFSVCAMPNRRCTFLPRERRCDDMIQLCYLRETTLRVLYNYWGHSGLTFWEFVALFPLSDLVLLALAALVKLSFSLLHWHCMQGATCSLPLNDRRIVYSIF
uniref:Secreted protein n=1 Tax=Ixodes scapularis TaxID=6945 RepID=A0A4D5RCS8_IXOSC